MDTLAQIVTEHGPSAPLLLRGLRITPRDARDSRKAEEARDLLRSRPVEESRRRGCATTPSLQG
ncbi:hypothetical protein [Nocardiopsis ganjiahuensis]|uniref:hypothetical protein n=1 Tax=Nocardiopsis ganjiahuensis TaxID=239984 RepID=UPI00034799D8|nr:hypothetical protein [Nocardiopsis ganjiahuensis]